MLRPTCPRPPKVRDSYTLVLTYLHRLMVKGSAINQGVRSSQVFRRSEKISVDAVTLEAMVSVVTIYRWTVNLPRTSPDCRARSATSLPP